MKIVSTLLALLLLGANGFALLPEAGPYQPYLSQAAAGLGGLVLIAILATRRRRADAGPARDPVRPLAEAARPAPPPANQAEAEMVGFLAILQDKGRLVDFLMDDINAYDDAQVGAAARVVHAGCKAALLEHFQIHRLRPENEGATVQVPAGYAADEYRLLGHISGPAPFTGVLVHHGWATDGVKLPRLLHASPDRLPAIAPAEVELGA
jgi:hypothetical protein